MPHAADPLGITISPEALRALVMLGEQLIANASQGRGQPRCAWDSSGLALTNPLHNEANAPALLIDIGGTHTKVACVNEGGTVHLLFDHDNEWFRPQTPNSKSPLQQFIQGVLTEVRSSAPHLAGSPKPIRVGVIWSNQVRTSPLVSDGVEGITGLVSGLHLGGYRKGEWFLEGLRDGDDIGAAVHAEIVSSGISANVILLGNDTIFTLFASHGSNSGTVISSGANCTAVGSGSAGEHTIYNTELGGSLMIPSEICSRGDEISVTRKAGARLALEELCAGAWFSEMCVAHIEALAILPEGGAITPLQDALHSGALTITNADLSAILSESKPIPQKFVQFSHDTMQLLTSTIKLLIERAGALSSVLIYLSVSNQIARGSRSLCLALDSAMARHFSGFLESIEQHLRQLLPLNIEYTLELIKPIKTPLGAEITVPMLGLSRALREYQRRG